MLSPTTGCALKKKTERTFGVAIARSTQTAASALSSLGAVSAMLHFPELRGLAHSRRSKRIGERIEILLHHARCHHPGRRLQCADAGAQAGGQPRRVASDGF